MFNWKIIVLVSLLSISVDSVLGQKSKAKAQEPPEPSAEETKAAKKDANTMFTTTDYRGALSAYQELYNGDPQNIEYNYRLGYCYLVTTVNKKAAQQYLEVAVESEKEAKPEWFFYMGMAYMYNEQWDAAISSFTDYKTRAKSKLIKDFPTPDRAIEMCKSGKELSAHPVNCTFTNLGKIINSSYEEYSPQISADGNILFFTSRRKGNAGTFLEDQGVYTSDIYSTFWKDTVWNKPRNLGANVNTGFDEESVSLSPVANQLYVYFDNEEQYGDIGLAILKGKMWQKPIMLSPNINSKEVESDACFSPDGSTLIFTSNRKEGGTGGKDLWMSKKEDGSWGKAVNLGNTINTTYDEKSPFLSLDGKRLYFSSKGWNSMGDYDIFYSNYEGEGKWSKPTNIGFPINDADDNSGISFTGDNRFAYKSAVKSEGLGDRDIYRIEFLDSTAHPFAHVIQGIMTVNSGKLEIKKLIIENTKSGVKTDCRPDIPTNQFILAVDPGEYKVTLDAKNCLPFEDTFVVGNEYPPVKITKNIQLQSSR